MKFNNNNNGFRDVLFRTDISNTLTGGSVEVNVSREENEESNILTFDIPSVSIENIEVSLNGNVLDVVVETDFVDENGEEYTATLFENQIILPVNIQSSEITADHDGRYLTITLPSDGTDAYDSSEPIEIRKVPRN